MKVCPSCKLVFNHEPLPKCLRCGGELEDWHSVFIMSSSARGSTPRDSKSAPIAAAAAPA